MGRHNKFGSSSSSSSSSSRSSSSSSSSSSLVTIWNRTRPRALVQNQHTREITSAAKMMYLRWWSYVPCILLACHVSVTVGDSGLCCCVCVTSFERHLTLSRAYHRHYYLHFYYRYFHYRYRHFCCCHFYYIRLTASWRYHRLPLRALGPTAHAGCTNEHCKVSGPLSWPGGKVMCHNWQVFVLFCFLLFVSFCCMHLYFVKIKK